MGTAGLAVGLAVGTEFLLGVGEGGLGVGTLGKLGTGRAPSALAISFIRTTAPFHLFSRSRAFLWLFLKAVA